MFNYKLIFVFLCQAALHQTSSSQSADTTSCATNSNDELTTRPPLKILNDVKVDIDHGISPVNKTGVAINSTIDMYKKFEINNYISNLISTNQALHQHIPSSGDKSNFCLPKNNRQLEKASSALHEKPTIILGQNVGNTQCFDDAIHNLGLAGHSLKLAVPKIDTVSPLDTSGSSHLRDLSSKNFSTGESTADCNAVTCSDSDNKFKTLHASETNASSLPSHSILHSKLSSGSSSSSISTEPLTLKSYLDSSLASCSSSPFPPELLPPEHGLPYVLSSKLQSAGPSLTVDNNASVPYINSSPLLNHLMTLIPSMCMSLVNPSMYLHSGLNSSLFSPQTYNSKPLNQSSPAYNSDSLAPTDSPPPSCHTSKLLHGKLLINPILSTVNTDKSTSSSSTTVLADVPKIHASSEPIELPAKNVDSDALSPGNDQSSKASSCRCTVCHKEFSSVANLKLHAKLHTGNP